MNTCSLTIENISRRSEGTGLAFKKDVIYSILKIVEFVAMQENAATLIYD